MIKSTLLRLCAYVSILVVASTAALRPCPTYACSCAPFQAPGQAKDGAAAVFAGRVVSTQPIKSRLEFANRFPFVRFERDIFGQRQVVFEVSEVWKGEVGQKVSVATGGMCGAYPFVRDAAYIVYGASDGSGITATMCNRVKAFDSLEDRNALGVGTKVAGFQMDGASKSLTAPVIVTGAVVFVALFLSAIIVSRRATTKRSSPSR